MPNSAPASGTRQKSSSQGMPPGDPAQRAQLNNAPLPNALIAGSQAAPQSAPALKGNELTAALAQGHAGMSPQERAKEEARADWQVHAYGTLARKPDLTMQDVISMAAQSVVDGKATPQEASTSITGLPQNPTKLRQAMQQHFVAAILNASLLSGSSQQATAPQQGVPPPQMDAGDVASQPQMTFGGQQ